jgi:hypothetical protein
LCRLSWLAWEFRQEPGVAGIRVHLSGNGLSTEAHGSGDRLPFNTVLTDDGWRYISRAKEK